MEEDGIPTVRNRKETSYEATRMGTALQPYTYYGEFISLDGASAKGGGKAEYKSITPENVFFDDSKICFFNINLDRKGKKTEVTFKRTFHDLHYFTRIYLGEDYFKANNIHHSAIPLPFPVDRKEFYSFYSL